MQLSFLSFYHPEFERKVRECINVYDRAITTEDILPVVELDLSNIYFKEEDLETLFLFTNLRSLSINLDSRICFRRFGDLGWTYCGNDIDFGAFAKFKKLTNLSVFGGKQYSIPFVNLEALIPITSLNHLQLNDFGPVDLSPLCKMPQLKKLTLCNSRLLQNISAIGYMPWLKELILENLYIENHDFLDLLPDTVYLEMSGIEIRNCDDTNIEKWKKFKKHGFCEIMIRGKDENRYFDFPQKDD